MKTISAPAFWTMTFTADDTDWHRLGDSDLPELSDGSEVVIQNAKGNTGTVSIAYDDETTDSKGPHSGNDGIEAAPFVLRNGGDYVRIPVKGLANVAIALSTADDVVQLIFELDSVS